MSASFPKLLETLSKACFKLFIDKCFRGKHELGAVLLHLHVFSGAKLERMPKALRDHDLPAHAEFHDGRNTLYIHIIV